MAAKVPQEGNLPPSLRSQVSQYLLELPILESLIKSVLLSYHSSFYSTLPVFATDSPPSRKTAESP